MATPTWAAWGPRARRRRERLHRRTWGVQRMSWMTLGGFVRRTWRCRRPVAGDRQAQAEAFVVSYRERQAPQGPAVARQPMGVALDGLWRIHGAMTP
jgi:hypothetical protein